MRHLLNTLFVTSEDIYLSLEGENVLANRGNDIIARYPLHTLQSILVFSYAGASPALMGSCAARGIDLVFCTPRGRFLARTVGMARGNMLLRREQYRKAFLLAWQNRKQECIKHPYLEEKMPWGLVPYIQALLLARTIRGDLEAYPPFLWK